MCQCFTQSFILLLLKHLQAIMKTESWKIRQYKNYFLIIHWSLEPGLQRSLISHEMVEYLSVLWNIFFLLSFSILVNSTSMHSGDSTKTVALTLVLPSPSLLTSIPPYKICLGAKHFSLPLLSLLRPTLSCLTQTAAIGLTSIPALVQPIVHTAAEQWSF